MFVEGGRKGERKWPKHANAIKKEQEEEREEEGSRVQWLDGDGHRAALCLTATLALSPTAARGRPLL